VMCDILTNQFQFLTSSIYSLSINSANFPSNRAPTAAANGITTEATVSEALLTLSSVATSANAQRGQHRNPSTFPKSNCNFPSSSAQHVTTGYFPVTNGEGHWTLQAYSSAVGLETANQAKSARRVSVTAGQNSNDASMYPPRPVLVDDDGAPIAKKARTVSPTPSQTPGGRVSPTASSEQPVQSRGAETVTNSVSCVCPVCNRQIKGLEGHKVDWSQPVQGRQRAKTITSIKKHVQDFHENEPIWNVIVNSLDIPSSSIKGCAPVQQPSRFVTARAFVTQALKKAALDQIPNTKEELTSLRWTEKILDQRVGIAKGFIQFGGQEYLRNKECQDEDGNKINPKSLRNLAYSLLQSMYDELLEAWNQNQSSIESAMRTVSLGLLRNRFQLLFAAPDKWTDSFYFDPSKYSTYDSPSH